MRLQASELLRDERNLALLRLLRRNPRAGISELARRDRDVGARRARAPAAPRRERRHRGLSPADGAAGARLPDLRLHPRAADAGKLAKIIEVAEKLPEVVECYRITGEDCFIIKAHLKELDALDQLLDRFLVYGQTTTSLAQSVPIPLRDLPLPGD